MAISMTLILGLACTFYSYVAVRWWREVMLVRREGKQSSATVAVLARAQEDGMAASDSRRSERYGTSAGMTGASSGQRDVIVMGRPNTQKQKKRVVA